jgi:hypothetical protein
LAPLERIPESIKYDGQPQALTRDARDRDIGR